MSAHTRLPLWRGRRWPAVLASLLALAAALAWPRPAGANAAPPVPHLWFKLVYPEGRPGPLQGAQLWQCTDAGCASRQLLGQEGSCTVAACAGAAAGASTPAERFECAEDFCLASWGYDKHPERGALLQLVLQYPAGAAASPAFAFGPPDYGLLRQQWQVAVTAGGLEPTLAAEGDGPAGPGLAVFLANLALTLAVELVIAGLLMAALPAGRAWLPLVLGTVAGINLLTFPVVWLFFPALTAFRTDVARTGGCLSFVPLGYALAAYLAFRVRRRRLRIALIVALVISVPVTGAAALLMLFFSSYGRQLPSAAGLPAGQALLLSEAFAVVCEGFLLRLFARRGLSWGWAGLLSLAINAASFGAGLAAAAWLPGVFV